MANSVRLSYSEAGQGTPLVLLHGFPLGREIWRGQMERLRENCRVIVPDLRGHGLSPAPAGVYEMEVLAGDVLTMLDDLQIPRAVIMGHSMGGYVALAALRLAPQRVLALGLIASQAGADTEEGRQGRHKLADKVVAEGNQAAAEAMLPRLFAPGFPRESPILDQVRQLILNTPTTGIVGSLQGMALRPDSSALLANLRLPVLLVAGENDQIIAPEKTTALAATLKSPTMTTIAHAGHMPMLEQPASTTAALEQFVSKLAKR